jgi:hypothetical protein
LAPGEGLLDRHLGGVWLREVTYDPVRPIAKLRHCRIDLRWLKISDHNISASINKRLRNRFADS